MLQLTLIASFVATAFGCGLLSTEPRVEKREAKVVSLDAASVDTFTVAYGETIEVEETGLLLRFEEVEDSRCAADVTCVWEGEATLGFYAVRGEEEARVDLKIPGLVEVPFERNASVEIMGHQVRLLRVDPYPFSSSPQRDARAMRCSCCG